MRIKSAIIYSTSRPFTRGLAGVVDFWPNRVIILGSQSSDSQKLANDWIKIGRDLNNAIAKTTNG